MEDETQIINRGNLGEIKFYLTLTEISETYVDHSEQKKLRKQLKLEKSMDSDKISNLMSIQGSLMVNNLFWYKYYLNN